ncbi:MAG: hypothetical protein HZC28_10265 [Spirochaetes bacterium]|nr:hypothetical protein [Spirochaetota bacterium]
MKKLLFGAVVLALSSMLFPATYRVAVMDFQGKAVSADDASALADSFRAYLVDTKMFTVIDRASMDKIMKEQSFQQTGCSDTACAVQIGKILNMEYMFTGTLSKFGSTYTVSVNLINVETSEITAAKQAKVKGEMDALLEEVGKIARDFANMPAKRDTRADNRARDEQEAKAKRDAEEKARRDMDEKSRREADERARREADDRSKRDAAARARVASGAEPNILKPILFWSSIGVAAAGVAINTMAYLDPIQKYDNYKNATGDFANKWLNYSNAVVNIAPVNYIVAWSCYGAAVGLAAWWFFTPEMTTTAMVIPYYDGQTAALAFSARF